MTSLMTPILQAAATEVQKTAAQVSSGEISTIAWTIISAMGVAIAGLAIYVKMLHNQLTACQEARVKTLEDQLSLVRTAKKEISPSGGSS